MSTIGPLLGKSLSRPIWEKTSLHYTVVAPARLTCCYISYPQRLQLLLLTLFFLDTPSEAVAVLSGTVNEPSQHVHAIKSFERATGQTIASTTPNRAV